MTELNNFLIDKRPEFKTSKYHAYYVDWKDRCCSYDSNKNPKKYSHIRKIFINQDEMQKANYLSIVELKRSFFLGFHGVLDPHGNFEDTIYYPQDHPYTPIDWLNVPNLPEDSKECGFSKLFCLYKTRLNPTFACGKILFTPCPFWIRFCQLNFNQKFPNFFRDEN